MSSLRLDGSASICTAAEIRDRLSQAITAGGEVSIDCSAVDEADITFLQVLVAAAHSAAEAGATLRLAPPPPGLAALADRAGLALPAGLIPE